MRRILFVCTGNTCRSPMAAALFRDAMGADATVRTLDIEVGSAGTGAVRGDAATPLAVEAMKRRGIPLDGHRATPVSRGLVEKADLVLTMTTHQKTTMLRGYPDAAGKVFTLTEYAGGRGDVADPLPVGTREAYERCAAQLSGMIPAVLESVRRSFDHVGGTE